MGGILSWALANAPKISPNTNVPANRPSIVLVLPHAIGTSRHGVPHLQDTARLMLPEFYTPSLTPHGHEYQRLALAASSGYLLLSSPAPLGRLECEQIVGGPLSGRS